jgi:hypothetical protein
MNAVRNSATWGANGAADPLLQDPRSIGTHARRIQRDAATLAAEVRDTTADVERYLSDRVRNQPYSTLGAAAGVGYVLGGGLRSPLTAVLLGAAARLASVLVVRELAEIGERWNSRAPRPATSSNPPGA